ncbi:hypothetical protein V8F20_010537 [Naviculisporaceae sp. PSN 640]
MDTRSNNDDTTTTEYDSGGSEGVDYAYKGQQVQPQALPAAIRRGSIESSASQRKHGHGHGAATTTRKERSPKRRSSPPRANSGKARTTPPTRCVCGRPARDSDSESTASTTTDFSSSPSDTEDETGPGKRIAAGPRKSRPSMSGPRDRTGESYSKSYSYEDNDDYLSDRARSYRDCGRKCCKQTKQQQQKRSRKYSTNTATSSSATKKKKTPYIEEYPEEIRPVVLLKEHKLPRGSFSSSIENKSNMKNRIRAGTDDPQQMSSSLGKIQTMGEKGSSGKRPTWPSSSREEREREREREQERSSSQSSSDQQHQQQSRRRRHHGTGREHGHGHSNTTKMTRHEVPGGRFSGSDLDDHDDDYSSESSSDDRELVRHHEHDRPRRPSMVRRNSRNQPERGPGAEVPSTVSRSSAAREHSSSPRHSSAWPANRSSPSTRQHRIIHEEPEQMDEEEMEYSHHAAPRHGYTHGHGYESGDESDDIFSGQFEFDETTHRRKPRRPPSPPPATESIAPTDSISRRGEHMHRHQHHSYREQQQALHRQPSQHLEPIHHDDDRDRPRRRTVKPPRPPVARTVVSRPSMGALDQGIDSDRAGAYAASTTDIWRGRPEDWESPYSESSDHEDDDGYDDGGYYRGRGGGGGDDAPVYDYGYDHMMLLEGDRHRSRAPSHVGDGYGMHMPMPRSSSPQLLPPRRSGDLKSVFSLGFNARRDLSPVGTHLSRRPRAGDAADEHTSGGGFLMPPAPPTRGGGRNRNARSTRAPSRAATERSRWTVMVPEYDVSDYGYGYPYGGNDYGIDSCYSPPPAPAPIPEEEEEDALEGYYSYGFAPSIRVQAPSPPLRFAGRRPPCAMTEEEEMEHGYGEEGYGRASGGLLSPVPTRTAAARFNFDKSWSELSRLLL